MEDLLPHYEQELRYLREASQDFAARYPRIASQLRVAPDQSRDPHVERLIQSFALMSARIQRKLDDDYPEFTESLLELLYPHFLQPFPACSIACFRSSGSSATARVRRIPRGTPLRSSPVENVSCQFETAYNVDAAPLSLSRASFASPIQTPVSVISAPDSTAQITLEIVAEGEEATLDQLDLDRFRLFVDAEPSFASVILDTLLLHLSQAFVQSGNASTWRPLTGNPVHGVGYEAQERLIDCPDQSNPAYSLVMEYFAFPEKFHFIDLDWPAIRATLPADTRSLCLHLILKNIPPDSTSARLLSALSAGQFRTHCTPIINRFSQRSEPIRLDHRRAAYPVIANSRHPAGYELLSVNRVWRVRQAEQAESVREFRHFHALRSGESLQADGFFWSLKRDPRIRASSPGHEAELTLVDADFQPDVPVHDTLSVDIRCSNRDLPQALPIGRLGGDLTAEGTDWSGPVDFLRKPTPTRRLATGGDARWKLIAHLASDHSGVIAAGASGLRELLALYRSDGDNGSHKPVDGIRELTSAHTTAWVSHGKYRALARGTGVTLTLDTDQFVGASVYVFAQVIARLLGHYAPANSFIQLTVATDNPQQVILECPPRSGHTVLA